MRGVETRIQEIRHAVFTEVAKMAYEEGPVDKKIEALPYKIIISREYIIKIVMIQPAMQISIRRIFFSCILARKNHIEEQQNQHQYLMELWKQISQKVTTLHHSLM